MNIFSEYYGTNVHAWRLHYFNKWGRYPDTVGMNQKTAEGLKIEAKTKVYMNMNLRLDKTCLENIIRLGCEKDTDLTNYVKVVKG